MRSTGDIGATNTRGEPFYHRTPLNEWKKKKSPTLGPVGQRVSESFLTREVTLVGVVDKEFTRFCRCVTSRSQGQVRERQSSLG